MAEDQDQGNNTTTIDEFENRFNEIDSELDALRSSIFDDDHNGDDDEGRSNAVTGNRDENITTRSSESSGAVHVDAVAGAGAGDGDGIKGDAGEGSLRAVDLAEQSVAEMEAIVKTLQQQQQREGKEPSLFSPSEGDMGSRSEQTSISQNKAERTTSSSSWSMTSWILFAIPILVSIGLAWKLSTVQQGHGDDNTFTDGGSGMVMTSQDSNKQGVGGGSILNKIKRKKERCKNVDGQKYCETEEIIGNKQSIFQKCWYVNDESYCETFEQVSDLEDDGDDGGGDTLMKLMSGKLSLTDEFRIADTNQDQLVSKSEFKKFKNDYLKIHPEITESNFVQFDDFDTNGDGMITTEEHEGYYQRLEEDGKNRGSILLNLGKKGEVPKPLISKQSLADEFYEFFVADTNKDQSVDRAEFGRFKRNYLKTHPEVDGRKFAKFEDFDYDRNGFITMDEYQQYYSDFYLRNAVTRAKETTRPLFTKKQLLEEFRAADTNKDGQVDSHEYERYKRNYLQLHPQVADNFAMFTEFDPNNDGVITMTEHENYYKIRGLL